MQPFMQNQNQNQYIAKQNSQRKMSKISVAVVKGERIDMINTSKLLSTARTVCVFNVNKT